jgi:hypothetical protein
LFAIVVVAALGVAGWRIDAAAYERGVAAAAAQHEAAVRVLEARLEAASKRARAAEAARIEAERARDDLRAELDEQGRADPDAGRRALGADSMLRIDRIRRED